MRNAPREDVDDHDADHDESYAENCGQVERLPEQEETDEGDQDDANCAPDCVGDSDRKGTQGEREEVKGGQVTHAHHYRWAQARELLRPLQEGGADYLKDDGSGEMDVAGEEWAHP